MFDICKCRRSEDALLFSRRTSCHNDEEFRRAKLSVRNVKYVSTGKDLKEVASLTVLIYLRQLNGTDRSDARTGSGH